MSLCPHCTTEHPDENLTFYALVQPVTANGITSVGTAACPDCRPLLEAGRAGDLARRAPAEVTGVLSAGEVGDLVAVLARICAQLGPPLSRADFDARIEPLLAVGHYLGIPTIELEITETEEASCPPSP